jgi:fibronectin type 3 domain-containing protein
MFTESENSTKPTHSTWKNRRHGSARLLAGQIKSFHNQIQTTLFQTKMKYSMKAMNLTILAALFALICTGVNCAAQVCSMNFDVPGYFAGANQHLIGNAGAQKATNYVGQAGYADPGHNFWNPYAIGGTTGAGTNSDDATVSPITVSDNNLPANSYERTGTIFVGLTNLESPFVFAKTTGPALVTDTLNNVPQGTYNLYLYGKNAGYNSDSTLFSVSAGATSYGSQAITNTTDSVFTYNNDYTVFSNIVVSTSGGTITFTYAPNTAKSGVVEGDFSGIQLVTVSLAFAGGPQYFAATPGNGHVSLSWLPVSTAASYDVYRGTSAGGETLLASGISAPSYNDTSVINGTTYYYDVTAVDSSSTQSPNSTELSATPLGPPPAPTWVSVTAGTPAQVDLIWNPSPSAAGYYLLRGTASGSYTVTNFFSGINNTNYIDTSVLSGTTYYYVVYGTNISGAGPFSVQMSATPTGAPAAPTSLNAQITASSQITLSWTGSFGATGYKVYRGTISGGETLLASGISGTTYVDNGVVNGTTYYYEVTTVGTGGESADSSEISAGQYVSENASGGLVNTWWNQASQWSNNLAPIPGISYEMSVTGGTSTYYGVAVGGAVLRTAAGSTNDTFQGGCLAVTPGVLLMKNLIGSVVNVNLFFTNFPAFNGTGYPTVRLAPSTSGNGTTTLSGTITNLTDSYLADDEQANNTFKITSTVVGTSNIFVMSSSGGTFTINNTNLLTGDWSGFSGTLNIGNLFCGGVVELNNSVPGMPNMALALVNPQGILNLDEPVSVQSFSDAGQVVSPGTYTASALNALGDGGTFNGTGSLTIGFSAPVIVSATTSLGHVNLSWTAISGAVSYDVYRGTSSGGETLLASGVTSASYVDSAVANGVTYFYEITAVNGSSVQTSDSPEVSISAIVAPLPPTSFSAFSTSTQQVTLSWTASAGATNYDVYRGTSPSGETLLASSVSGTNYVDNTVVRGTTYYYEVTAVSTGGQSTDSTEASVTAGFISEVSSGGTLGSTWDQGSQWVGGAVPTNNGIEYIMGATNNSTPFTYYGVEFGGAAIRTAAVGTNDTFLGTDLAVTPGEILVKDTPGANLNVNLIFPYVPALSGFGYPMVRLAPSASGLGVTTLSGTITNLTDSYLADDEQAAGTFNITSTVVGVSNIFLMSSFGGTFTVDNTNLLTGDWSGFSGTLNIGNLYCGGVVELNNSVPGMPNMALALVNPQGVLNLDEPVSVQSFSDAGIVVSPGTYTASALNALGDGGIFNGIGSLTIGFTAPVIISAKGGTSQISLSWTAISGAVSYDVYRGTSSGGETLLAGGVTSTSYVDSAVTSGVTYYYEVTAVNGSSTQTGDSPEVSATVISSSPPHITGIQLSGTSLSITATNGTAGGMWTLLQSTNLALPISQWTPVLTNTFDGGGSINLTTNIVNPANPRDFYILEEP